MSEILTLADMTAAGWQAVSAALDRGGLVCLPSDTVYGLACLPTANGALENIYEVKGREHGKPIALVFAAVSDIFDSLTSLPERTRRIMAKLMPGPVTLVVAADPHEKTALGMPEADGLGIRVIPSPLGRLYKALPGPLAVTSANLSGQPAPCSIEEIPASIMEACDFVINAGRTPICTPSTVVDLRPLATGGFPIVIREGALPATDVRKQIDSCGC